MTVTSETPRSPSPSNLVVVTTILVESSQHDSKAIPVHELIHGCQHSCDTCFDDNQLFDRKRPISAHTLHYPPWNTRGSIRGLPSVSASLSSPQDLGDFEVADNIDGRLDLPCALETPNDATDDSAFGDSKPDSDSISIRRPVSSISLRPTSTSRVASALEPRSSRGWKCDKNFESDSATTSMKVWPQVLASMVAALAHLALGAVLAYPAIALPLLTALPATQSTLPPSIPPPDLNTSSVVESNTGIKLLSVPGTKSYEQLGFSSEIHTAQTDYKHQSSGLHRPPLNASMTLLLESASLQQGNASRPKPVNRPLGRHSSTTWDDLFPAISVSTSQAAWLGSIHSLGAVLGSMVCGMLLTTLGQRRAILVVAPITLSTWLLIWAAPSTSAIILARFVAGICIGVLGTSGQVYIVETAHETIRGSLACITDMYVSIGLLLTYSLGASTIGWRWLAFSLGFITTVPLTVGLALFPDSPRWLAMKGRKEEARKSLQFLRGSSHNVTQELEKIMKVCHSKSKLTTWEQIVSLNDPRVYVPFLTSCGVLTFGQLSGGYVVYSYAVSLFQMANVSLSPYLSTVLVGVARFAGSCLNVTVVVERVGRRRALLLGSLGTAFSLTILGGFFYQQPERDGAMSTLTWVPLVSLIAYTIILGATISPVPFLLSVELLPLSFRSIGSPASKAVFFLAGMAATYSFPLMKSSIGPAYTIWMYAASAFVMFLFVWRTVPETKGKTLEEIEQYYTNMYT